MSLWSANSTRESKVVQLRNVSTMLQYKMDDSDFDVPVKHHLAVTTSKAHDILGHGDHALAKQIQIVSGPFKIIGMITADMINDFGGLSKARLIATAELALESHVTVSRLQMVLGILNIGIAKVAAVFALDVVQVVSGLEMILCPISFFVTLLTFLTIPRWRDVSNPKERVIISPAGL